MSIINKAIDDLKNGKLIIIADREDREGEGDLVGLAEYVTPEKINFMITNAKGLVCVPMDKKIADRLNIYPMVHENSDSFRTNFTVSVDSIKNTTGISAYERAQTIYELSNIRSTYNDFRKPGHIFPIIAKDGGVLVRDGHTEASIDLAKIANAIPVTYICEITNNDGTMANRKQLREFAEKHSLTYITTQDIIDYRFKYDNNLLKLESRVDLPTKFGKFKLNAYSYIADNKEYLAIINKNNLDANIATLVRIHSECLTGDVLASYRCDCRDQLEYGLNEISKAKQGVLFYLRQEGRGIGLLNKLKAYELQEQGLDTVEANLALGFPADNRRYGVVAAMLRKLNINNIKLMTNNPEKINQLKSYGINVIERIEVKVKVREENSKYLQTKKAKFHHLIDLD